MSKANVLGYYSVSVVLSLSFFFSGLADEHANACAHQKAGRSPSIAVQLRALNLSLSFVLNVTGDGRAAFH